MKTTTHNAGSLTRLVRRWKHKFAHLMGWNMGRVETWWENDQLMVGFRCECGILSDAQPCRTAADRIAPNSGD